MQDDLFTLNSMLFFTSFFLIKLNDLFEIKNFIPNKKCQNEAEYFTTQIKLFNQSHCVIHTEFWLLQNIVFCKKNNIKKLNCKFCCKIYNVTKYYWILCNNENNVGKYLFGKKNRS